MVIYDEFNVKWTEILATSGEVLYLCFFFHLEYLNFSKLPYVRIVGWSFHTRSYAYTFVHVDMGHAACQGGLSTRGGLSLKGLITCISRDKSSM